jgi:putative transposase
MPRGKRAAPGGYVYHVLNRGVGRRRLFDKPADYEAFEELLEETLVSRPMRVCGYCLMPNHWHLVLWPEKDGQLAAFMQRLTITHVTRWQQHRHKVGEGHLYQGRFKSFPVASDDHFYQLLRYVERNARRAQLAERAEAWRWGSLWRRTQGTREQRALLSAWPLPKPRDWVRHVNAAQHEAEIEAIRNCIRRGQPFGSDTWVRATAQRLDLQATLRPRGRPRHFVANEGAG